MGSPCAYVRPPLPAACVAHWIPAYPPLWAPGQPLSRDQARPLSSAAGSPRTHRGIARCTTGLPGPLSASHWGVAARLPALRSWPDGANRIFPAGGLAARSTAHPLMNASPAFIPCASRSASRSDRCPFVCSRPSMVRTSRNALVASPMHTPQPPVLRSQLNRAQLRLQFPLPCAPASRTWTTRC